MIALALGVVLSSFGVADEEGLRPLSEAEAAEAEPMLRVVRIREEYNPHSAILELLNPAPVPLSFGARADGGESVETVRVETWDKGAWTLREERETLTAAVVPTRHARTLKVRCPPSILPFRIGVRVRGAGVEWLYTAKTERPHNLIECPPGGPSGVHLRFLGFEHSGSLRFARLLACNPRRDKPAEILAADFGHPIGYEVRVLRGDTWSREGLAWCFQCARTHEIPPGMAMPFLVVIRPNFKARPFQVGLRFGGSQCWTEPIQPDAPIGLLADDVGHGPPAVTLDSIERAHGAPPTAWLRLENRGEDRLRVRARGHDPVLRVEVLVAGHWIDRTSRHAPPPDARDLAPVSEVEVPPRSGLLFPVPLHDKEPTRVGVELLGASAEQSVMWSEPIDPQRR